MTTNHIFPWKEWIKMKNRNLKGEAATFSVPLILSVEAEGSNSGLSLRVVNGLFIVCWPDFFGKDISSMRVGIG